MRALWKIALLAFLALTCVLLGMSIRVSFDWLDLEGAVVEPADVEEIARLREDLAAVRDPFEAVIKVAKVVQPSVVSIDVAEPVRRNGFLYTGGSARGGSGVILDTKGHVLTNWHVIGSEAPDLEIRVRVGSDEKRTYRAEIVGHDTYSDLAVVKIDAPGLIPARIGDSDAVEVGQAAIAIGSPFSLQGTVTLGMISSTARKVSTGEANDSLGVESYIQTDAAINPGNSGGPLVDIRGRVIGINTMIVTRTSAGVGFAIPVNYAKGIAEQIIEAGTVSRGGLGIKMSEEKVQSDGLPAGVLVVAVGPGGPAQRAGIRPGDLIVEYNGKRIESNEELLRQVQQTRLGTEARVVVLRRDRYLTLHPIIGDRDVVIRPLLGIEGEEPERRGSRRQ